MGFGLPAALGAKLASPDRTVIDIDGDGSFLMTAAELATASELSIGVKVLIFNNNSLAMVDRWQGMAVSGLGVEPPLTPFISSPTLREDYIPDEEPKTKSGAKRVAKPKGKFLRCFFELVIVADAQVQRNPRR